ncbi:hypothetical protein QOM21_18850 [Streptomyces sp. Pv4-95]|uniref:hypothetical protein n=1 Tax=Streptomyces sp. Pv4-95 TaxID=3049543 RepID=UPI003892B4ED
MNICADPQPAADASTPRYDTRHRAPHADHPLPAPGLAEVRIVSATPDAARQVAEVIHRVFVGEEQRSYPAGDDGSGTRLYLTVDTLREVSTSRGPAASAPPQRRGRHGSRTDTVNGRVHHGESG